MKNEIIIDGIKYAPATDNPPSPMQIVIAQRGWVWVGRVIIDGEDVTIHEARCIRRWVTTGGLAQIALNGPTKDTVLEDVCTVRLHVLTVVGRIDCDPTKW